MGYNIENHLRKQNGELEFDIFDYYDDFQFGDLCTSVYSINVLIDDGVITNEGNILHTHFEI